MDIYITFTDYMTMVTIFKDTAVTTVIYKDWMEVCQEFIEVVRGIVFLSKEK